MLAWSQPPLNSDLLVVTTPNLPHYHLFYQSVFPKARHDKQREGKERGGEKGGKTPLIYFPLRKWHCVSLSYAIVYCVWLSDEKKMERRKDELAAEPSKLLRVVACQHSRLSTLTNLVTRTHNHTLAQAQRESCFYTSNSGEAPNQTQKGQSALGHTLVLIIKGWDYS